MNDAFGIMSVGGSTVPDPGAVHGVSHGRDFSLGRDGAEASQHYTIFRADRSN